MVARIDSETEIHAREEELWQPKDARKMREESSERTLQDAETEGWRVGRTWEAWSYRSLATGSDLEGMFSTLLAMITLLVPVSGSTLYSTFNFVRVETTGEESYGSLA